MTMQKVAASPPRGRLLRLRLLIVAFGAFAFTFASPPTSFAASTPVTETTTRHGVVTNYWDVAPPSCDADGELYYFTTLANTVRHTTEFPDGRFHGATTETGRFVAEPLNGADGPTYSGRYTIKSGINVNGDVVTANYTYSITGTGSDGLRILVNAVEHFSLVMSPEETFKLFFRCH